MHLPSQRVLREMRSEAASIWFVPANNGTEIALLIKAPTTSIKAVLSGCDMALVFGLHDNVLCVAARIFDIPGHPLFISGVQRYAEEHAALQNLLLSRSCPTFLFNEMDICVAWANLSLTEQSVQDALTFIGHFEKLYVGNFSKKANHCLDCFSYTSDKTQTLENAKEIPLLEVHPTFDTWVSNHISFIGEHEYHTLELTHSNEGEMLERAIWGSLESAFSKNLYKGPQIRVGTKLRELSDILAWHEYGAFLIEAKDLSILQAGYQRKQQRRTAGVQKQIIKALGQLVGASKSIKSGAMIFDTKGSSVNPVRDKPLHCIVLLTELMHDGDWKDIKIKMAESMLETGDYFHVFDLAELIILLKGSSGKATYLDYNLMERCKKIFEHNNIHIRSRPAPTESILDE